jgi:hypothetical protein
MVSVTPRPHCSLEMTPVPMQQEAVWVPEQVWTFPREPYLVLGMWIKGGAELGHYVLR